MRDDLVTTKDDFTFVQLGNVFYGKEQSKLNPSQIRVLLLHSSITLTQSALYLRIIITNYK